VVLFYFPIEEFLIFGLIVEIKPSFYSAKKNAERLVKLLKKREDLK